MVKYQGNSFEVTGVKIPIPALGGTSEIGGVKYDPQILNRAYETTQILNNHYVHQCELIQTDLNISKEKLDADIAKLRDYEEQLTQEALSVARDASPEASKPESMSTSTTTANVGTIPAAKVNTSPEVKSRSALPSEGREHKTTLARWVSTYSKTDEAGKVIASRTKPKPRSVLGLPDSKP